MRYFLIILSLAFSTVTDIDGNVYEIVQPADHLLMDGNLKVIHYNNGDELIYSSFAEDEYQILYQLNKGFNFVSFPGYHNYGDFNSLLNSLLNEGGQVTFMMGNGLAMVNIGTMSNPFWVGNLTNYFNPTQGFWLNVLEPFDWTIEFDSLIPDCNIYNDLYSNVYISFKWGEGNAYTLEALGGEEFASENFTAILGQSKALFNTQGGWVGNLNILEKAKGYRIIFNDNEFWFDDFVWGFDFCSSGPTISPLVNDIPLPLEFQVPLSSSHSFYIIDSSGIINLTGYETNEDIILVYNYDNVLIGSAYFEEPYTVIPINFSSDAYEHEMYTDYGECLELFDGNTPNITFAIYYSQFNEINYSNDEFECLGQHEYQFIDSIEFPDYFIPIYGCTDEIASNYNPDANEDDGTCEYNYQLFGDVDENGLIDIVDILLVINIIMDGSYDILADYNQDNIVDILDVLQIVNYILSE